MVGRDNDSASHSCRVIAANVDFNERVSYLVEMCLCSQRELKQLMHFISCRSEVGLDSHYSILNVVCGVEHAHLALCSFNFAHSIVQRKLFDGAV